MAEKTHKEESDSLEHAIEPQIDRLIRWGGERMKNTDAVEYLRKHISPGIRKLIHDYVPSGVGFLIGRIPDSKFHSKTTAELTRGGLSELVETFCRVLYEGRDALTAETVTKAGEEAEKALKNFMDRKVQQFFEEMHELNCHRVRQMIATLKRLGDRPPRKDKDGKEIPGKSEDLSGCIGEVIFSEGLNRGLLPSTHCCMRQMAATESPKEEKKADKPAKPIDSASHFIGGLDAARQAVFGEMLEYAANPECQARFMKGLRHLNSVQEFDYLVLLFRKRPELLFSVGLQGLEDRDWVIAIKNFLRDLGDEAVAAEKPLMAFCRGLRNRYREFDDEMAYRAYEAKRNRLAKRQDRQNRPKENFFVSIGKAFMFWK